MTGLFFVFVYILVLPSRTLLAFRIHPSSEGVGDPLFLSPYIESGRVEEGQRAAYVEPLLGDIRSYAGFLTVNKTLGSNIYFWFFPAETSPDTAPVVVWLQGGPGSSSLYGLFEENGPFFFKKDGSLQMREIYWSQVMNVIFIDSPVGTGFSFTGSDKGYVKDQVQVGADLLSALDQFFKLFPKLRANDFFITGESYGGKYVPALAYTILKSENVQPINLKGIAIGNGFSDPEYMMNYGDYFYQLGIIDSNEREVFHLYEKEIVKNIQNQNFEAATDLIDQMILGDIKNTYFFNFTGFSFFYNFLHDKDYSTHGDMNIYVQKDFIRKGIHVGNLTFHTDSKVRNSLHDDISKSVKPWVQELVENYRVLIYNGQLDLIVPYPLTVNYLQSLNWSGSEIYKTAERKQWWVGGELAGYYKSVKGLTEVLVRNAGHMVPTDQPAWAMDLVTRFVFNIPLNHAPPNDFPKIISTNQ